MTRSPLPISDHRFKKSPFFKCNEQGTVLYGIYNNRLYPLDAGVDTKQHYETLRTACCLYDVPETPLRITGKDSLLFLERLFTRQISKIRVGRAGYAIACNHEGGVVMDGVLMRPNEHEYIYVQADGDFLNWASANLREYDAVIEDFDSWVLQIQGPTSLQVLEAVTGISDTEFSYYAMCETDINGVPCYVSRSGWTGERGFEIYSKGADFDGVALWEHLLDKGAPAGLIASDLTSMHIRRLEAGILDYGTDFDQGMNPFELGLGRLVHMDKPDFIGREALEATQRKSIRLLGVQCEDAALARGNEIRWSNGDVAGQVTAGAYSHELQCGVGFARLNTTATAGTAVQVKTDDGLYKASLVDLPFIDKNKLLVR